MNKKVMDIVKKVESELIQLNEYIYDNPELGFAEFKSAKAHINILNKHNFIVKENYCGFKTAFRATYDSKKDGPTIAYLAEYDALPGIGQACGHNLLGTISTGAGIILSKLIDEVGGQVTVIGTPAEETSGTKVDMVNEGVFDDVDVAMLVHPSARHGESGSSLAILPIEFVFKGKASHAASAPEQGINALDACMSAFNSINSLREHVLESTKIHGIIKEGGEAANIVPERAVAQFYVRTPELGYMEVLEEKVINCAKAGALSTGAELEINYFENPYDKLVTNKKLSDLYMKHLEDSGVMDYDKAETISGSMDMGNVSQVVPTIHPSVGIAEEGVNTVVHTREFTNLTITDLAYENMNKAIYSCVMTGLDVLEDRKLLKEIRNEFSKTLNL